MKKIDFMNGLRLKNHTYVLNLLKKNKKKYKFEMRKIKKNK